MNLVLVAQEGLSMDGRVYQFGPVDRDVFRAYDIRGIIGVQLTEDSFFSIAKAIAYHLNELGITKILVGRDGRLTSEVLTSALITGLLQSGIDVIDLGEVPTPVVYYATHVYGLDSGLMVTGSHNPSDYNGIKMVISGTTLANQEIIAFHDAIASSLTVQGLGKKESFTVLPDYIQRIVSDIELKKPFKVVADCGNGVAGPIVVQILEDLGCDVIPLYCEVDGHFPNHHPDPSVAENLRDLQEAVRSHQADIGLAFDGDADRLGVVTNDLEIIWPDRLMMFYAKHLLSQHPGETIVYDVKCSADLAKIITKAGGQALMSPTGHSLVKRIMKESNAILAGEMSGHIFFKDRWYGFDDALYSACRLLEMLSSSSLSVAEQFALIPNSVNTPEIKIPLCEEEKFKFMQEFIDKSDFSGADLIKIDGLRVEYPDGWGLLRASNTSPCLVARFEANDALSLTKIQDLFKKQLHALDQDLVLPF